MEIAWAAGLFDGEGSATVCRGRPRLAVRMTDEECVRRFSAAVGAGKVYGPYLDKGSVARDGCVRKPTFLWVADMEAGRQVAALLLPLLGSAKTSAIERAYGL